MNGCGVNLQFQSAAYVTGLLVLSGWGVFMLAYQQVIDVAGNQR